MYNVAALELRGGRVYIHDTMPVSLTAFSDGKHRWLGVGTAFFSAAEFGSDRAA